MVDDMVLAEKADNVTSDDPYQKIIRSVVYLSSVG
jgi:hypothetical protein